MFTLIHEHCTDCIIVPTFDGTKGFDLGNIAKLERYNGEILNDAAVLVSFTVGRYASTSKAKYRGRDVLTSISFNIQFVILVSAPSYGVGVDIDRPSEEPIGVLPEEQAFEGIEQVLTIEGASGEGQGVWM